MIKDNFNRVHDYLRVSLTDKCDLRCFYCMPEEDYTFSPSEKLMQADEIMSLARKFVSLGVKKIRLTGGEPLVRKDAADIMLALSDLPVELTLTTNGTRINEYFNVLKRSGIDSVNVSLDTLQPSKFIFMTRRDHFNRVYKNIDHLMEMGVHVKINMVVMKGLNEMEIPHFVEWTKDRPVHVRFIEFMPFSGNKWSSNQVFTWNEILQLIEKQYSYHPLQNDVHDTSKKYQVVNHTGTFAVISTMSAPFCSTCNRMRLTADGKMKNCLFSGDEFDLLGALRNGHDVIPLIHQAIGNKKRTLGGQLPEGYRRINTEEIKNRSMISIGG